MSLVKGAADRATSTDTITAETSETMMKIVDGEYAAIPRTCQLEIDVLQKHHEDYCYPTLHIEHIPESHVIKHKIMERIAIDIHPEMKKQEANIQASKFTLYDPHQILRHSRKGTCLNDPKMFNASPQKVRNQIERVPLLPRIGCSQVSFVARKQKNTAMAYTLSEKKSNPFQIVKSKTHMTKSQVSFSETPNFAEPPHFSVDPCWKIPSKIPSTAMHQPQQQQQQQLNQQQQQGEQCVTAGDGGQPDGAHQSIRQGTDKLRQHISPTDAER